MRNPDRLDNFYNTLKEYHKLYIPDWRFGQFILNFFNWMYVKKLDPFFPEEEKMIKYLEEYFTGSESELKNFKSC